MANADPSAADPWPAGSQPPTGARQLASAELAAAEQPTQLGPGVTIPLPGGSRRIPRWVALVAVATAVLSVAMFTTVLVWPGSGETDPLGFHPFEPVATVTLGDDQEAHRVQVEGDRIYLGWSRGNSLVVTAAELGGGETLWEQSLAGFSSLSTIHAGDGMVWVFGTTSLDWDPRPLVVLDAETGRQLWQRDYYGEDTWYVTADLLVLRDRENGQLRGLERTTGVERWSIPFQGRTVMVSVDEDLAGRSFRGGASYVPRQNEQVVVPGEDRAAQLIDLGDGEQIARQHNVGDFDENMVAHEDRLFVADTTADGYQLFAYDLTNFGNASPAVIYTGAAGRSPRYLTPCGADRLCVLETADGDEDGERTELIMVDAVEGQELWRQPAVGGSRLLPVGDEVVVHAAGPRVLGYDRDGTELFDRSGEVVRLNAGNVLIFASGLSDPEPGLSDTEPGLSDTEADLSVAGYAFESAELTELGQVPQVIGSGCAWGERHLVCPTGEGAGIWQFAAESAAD